MPIRIPEGVQLTVHGRAVKVKGPNGELNLEFDPRLAVEVKDNTAQVTRVGDEAHVRALHGLTRALVANMVHGVSKGFRKSLEIVGLGYRADLQGNELLLQVGHSHADRIVAPEGITFEIEKGNRVIHVDGADKELVGRMAAEIRAVRKPEPYRGKGIRYVGEQVRRKAGKAGKVALG
jgi:large subunit ribosomal protein L6